MDRQKLEQVKELYDVTSQFYIWVSFASFVDPKLAREQAEKGNKILKNASDLENLTEMVENATKDPRISGITENVYTPKRTSYRLSMYALGLIHDIYFEQLPEDEKRMYLGSKGFKDALNLFKSDIKSGLDIDVDLGPERTQRLFRSAFATAMREEKAPEDSKTFAQILFHDVKTPDETLQEFEQEIKKKHEIETTLVKEAISITKQWIKEPQSVDDFIKKYLKEIKDIS